MNVNSLCNKLESIQDLIKSTFDIILISETKNDDSFPNAQFKIEDHKRFRKDRDAFGKGVLFYINEKLNCRSIESCLPNIFFEILLLELRLLNPKWLVLGTYKPSSSSDDKILLLGDFNVSFSNKNMKDLCDMVELNHLIKDQTCFKS